jgi:hypothetical protein
MLASSKAGARFMGNLRTCPKCNGNDIYQRVISAKGGYFNLLPGIGNWLFGANLWVYVCGNCGHLEFSVPVEYLTKVRKNFERRS